MNPFGLSGLQEGISSVGFGLFVFLKGTNKKIVHLWSFFIFTITVWGFGTYYVSTVKDAHQALLTWAAIYTFGVPWIAAAFYHFISVFLELDNIRSILINYLTAFSFAFLFGIKRCFHVEWQFNSFFYIRGGKVYVAHLIWWLSSIVYS